MLFKEYERIYENKTQRSKQLFMKSSKIFPGGVSHNIRFFKPYPFFVTAANDKYLIDIDDNHYTDYWMGHWALILGHSPKPVTERLSEQITRGMLYGTVNNLSVDLGETVQKLIPKAESMRFSSTGSEATMYAVRLARAKTGRRVIAKVEGGWHGFNATLMQSVNFPFEIEEGIGIVQDEEQFIETIPFNDLDRSLKILESIKDDLACIIVEPLLGGAGCITAMKGYLHGLQEFARKNGSIFILDEIVTGFRLSIHGAADLYGLEPDLFTLGKILGGGLPIGAVCGDRDIMSLADPILRPDKDKLCAIGGGTFSANPLTMSAGVATLSYLMENKNTIYPKIDSLGDTIRKELTRLFLDSKIKVEVTGQGSLFLVHFLNDRVSRITGAVDVAISNRELLRKYHVALLAKYNIFFLPLKMGAISERHDITDIDKILSATASIIDSGILN